MLKKKIGEIYFKKPVLTGIVAAAIINSIFYLVEWLLWKYTNLCDGDSWHYYDFAIRMATGFLGIIALSGFYNGDLKSVFCGKCTKKVWLFCIPFAVSFLLSCCELFCAEEISTARTMSFLVAWLTQIGSGFFEEIVSRGVFMSGLIAKYKETVKGRLLIVVFAGLAFGFLHIMNFIFGNNFWDCVSWGVDTMAWGMMVAAIYLLSSNLWLVIGIHTAWDIICKIPSYFMVGVQNEPLYNVLMITENIVMNVVFAVCAVAICVWGFKKNSTEEKI